MLYLLDAGIIITAHRTAYPLRRFPVYWEWLLHQGHEGNVKIPEEQYEEVIEGTDELVGWCKQQETKEALLLDEHADPAHVRTVTDRGYSPDLNEDEVQQIGRDSFLISYAYTDLGNRTIVTYETSSPAKQRANRKVPDVCATLGVPCCTIYQMIAALDFSTDWRP